LTNLSYKTFNQIKVSVIGKNSCNMMSAYFCPHLMFNSWYLIEFVRLKSDLIDSSDN